jgi:hypothetical protein
MRLCFPLGAMLWLLCILQFVFYMACGCISEERIALMRVRSSFVDANSEFPNSWGQSDDCCSWEGVRCSSNSLVSHLFLNSTYVHLSNSYRGVCSSNIDLTMFSAFHELQLLDLSSNSAYFKSFEGSKLPSRVPMHELDYFFSGTFYQSKTFLFIITQRNFLRSSRID